jgi:hypothetical protein
MGSKEWLLLRDLVVAAYVVNSPNFLGISHIFLDVQLFQKSIGGDREFWGRVR